MNTDKRALLIAIIKKWHTYTDEELNNLSDFEVCTIGGYTMEAVQVAHGKTRSFSCWIITLIPVIVGITTAICYWPK